MLAERPPLGIADPPAPPLVVADPPAPPLVVADPPAPPLVARADAGSSCDRPTRGGLDHSRGAGVELDELQRGQRDQRLQQKRQRLAVERLGQHTSRRTAIHAILVRLVLRIVHQDERRPRELAIGADTRHQAKAVDRRLVDGAEDQVWAQRLDQGQRLFGGIGGRELVALTRKQRLKVFAGQRIGIDNEQGRHVALLRLLVQSPHLIVGARRCQGRPIVATIESESGRVYTQASAGI